MTSAWWGAIFAVALALAGAGCSGKPLGQTSPADGGDDGICHDLFEKYPDGSSPAVPCCPEPAPDCSKEPNGYPGNNCVDRQNQFCACQCYADAWSCAC